MGIAPGRHLRIFDAYIEAREQAEAGMLDAEESMSTSDFATYMGKLVRHSFLERFEEVQGTWGSYTRDVPLDDFEEYTSSRFGRFPDIPEHALNSEYPEMAIREYDAERLRLREWGAAFSVTRQLILADRLNKISELPTLAAEALARTMSKKAAIDSLQNNPTMYDGNALISVAHGNRVTTALAATVQGMTDLQTLDLKFDDMTDDEGYAIVSPGGRTLLIPTELRFVAQAINQNQLLPNGSSQLEANLMQGYFDNVIIEPFFTDANNYYILADPTGRLSPIAAVNLSGNKTPFVGLKDPGVKAILGGNDPYSFEFDEVKYKIRHDFHFRPVEWRGIIGAIVA
jgi:hypothetical protein